MRRMRTGAALALALALAVTGCGGDDEGSGDTTTTEAGAVPTEAPESTDGGAEAPSGEAPSGDDCAYLATDVLAEAVGAELELLAAGEVACTWSGDDGLSVSLSRIDIQIDPEEYAEESTASCDEGTVEEVDAGDYAYSCIAIGPTASWYDFDEAVLLNLGTLGSDDEVEQQLLEAFTAVLPDMTLPA